MRTNNTCSAFVVGSHPVRPVHPVQNAEPPHPVGLLSPAAAAFDAVAPRFDARFGAWLSVAAQRRAVRAALLDAFPVGARVLELGGGTGEDAAWLARRGRTVLLTDPSPAMVREAAAKLVPLGMPEPTIAPAERLPELSELHASGSLDGAFSNFAALNCVTDLAAVGLGLARLVRPGGRALLVVFGTLAVGEWVVQLARGDARAAFRRLARGDVPARLGGHDFSVRYHRGADLVRALAPWFRPVARRGIGVCVPPSAAEPWISRHPRLLGALEAADRVVSRPLAALGDHVLYDFVRTETAA
ncbi:type 11 methyltransferase [Gemmatirosa kalamazoonensis]|uniref:Type 11 methyltransferase n=1 Tax=Gemmatirosa kalamazoonensis TaxID=861299 RepID=W0RBB0_9BACT|nr:class I SAM-dependent methyltransferase [Gemmatirosa kalamazoonensis]AHG88384.1 type 11 methyltransferase [Gemmatirosa kalamazoonensis]